MGNTVVCCSSLEAPEAAEDQPEVAANLGQLPVLPTTYTTSTSDEDVPRLTPTYRCFFPKCTESLSIRTTPLRVRPWADCTVMAYESLQYFTVFSLESLRPQAKVTESSSMAEMA